MREMLPSEWQHRKFAHAWVAVSEYLPTIVQSAATVLAAAAGIVASLPTSWEWDETRWGTLFVCIAVAGICFVVGPILKSRARRGIVALEAKIRKAEIRHGAQMDELRAENQARVHGYDVDVGHLRRHVENLALILLASIGISDSRSRISVYQHEEHHGVFIQVGRSSPSARWRRKGRGTYPDTMGLIAEAWNNGDSFNSTRYTDPDRWARLQANKHGIPLEVAKSISMKARCTLGVRITYENRDVGVLMAESMTMEAVTTDNVNDIKEHPAYELIGAMLAVGPKLPPSLAVIEELEQSAV